MLVLDCSVLMAWAMPDEDSNYANAIRKMVIEHNLTIIVPPLFFLEVINVLNVMERRKRIDPEQAENALRLLQKLPVTVDTESTLLPAILRVRQCMLAHELTAYDASYLELAQRRDMPLSTLDKALRSAAEKEEIFFAAKM